MSYANPIDTRIVQVVLDDLEDCNFHALCDLLAYAYGLPRNLPQEVLDEAYERAKNYLVEYRLNRVARVSDGVMPCPNHEGAYDCTPFCELCEGNQEYLPGCSCGQTDPLPIAHNDGCPVWETARQEQEESEAAL